MAAAEPVAVEVRIVPAPSDSLVRWFDRAWSFAHAMVFDSAFAANAMGPEDSVRFRERAAATANREELAALLTGALRRGGWSHTGVYTPRDLDWWVLRSILEHEPGRARACVWHSGAMFAPAAGGWRVRATLEGYPANLAGLRRGDVVLTADGAPFHPFASFADGRAKRLAVRRGRHTLRPSLQPVFEDPLESFALATRNSARVLRIDGRSIGVIHAWQLLTSGALSELHDDVLGELGRCDGLVLDLRDGFGGINDCADLFDSGPSPRVAVGWVGRNVPRAPDVAPLSRPHVGFRGAIVAIVNEGTRSQKEILAFQLQRHDHVPLVGSRTAGAVCNLVAAFADAGHRLIVEVPSAELTLDGEHVEGAGLKPDLDVPWPADHPGRRDPQMEAALRLVRERLGR